MVGQGTVRVCVRPHLGAQVCVPVLLRPWHGLLKSPAPEKELTESNLRGVYETLTSAEFSKTVSRLLFKQGLESWGIALFLEHSDFENTFVLPSASRGQRPRKFLRPWHPSGGSFLSYRGAVPRAMLSA